MAGVPPFLQPAGGPSKEGGKAITDYRSSNGHLLERDDEQRVFTGQTTDGRLSASGRSADMHSYGAETSRLDY